MDEELTDYERQQQEEAREAIRALTNYVNRHNNMEPLVEALAREHRTLQQLATNFMLRWFVHLSTLSSDMYDPRNEASVEISKKICQIEDVHWRLPLI